jgi:hypothetical protein
VRSPAGIAAVAVGGREHAMIGNLASTYIVIVMQRMVMMMSLGLAACSAPHSARAPTEPRLAEREPSGPGVRRNLGDDDDIKCTIEVRTGTSLSRPICRSEVEIQEDLRQAREILAHPSHPAGRR